jgi:hypothetical protein
MEQLRTELSHLLGEKLSRVECVSEKPSSALWSLYDAQGNPMPLLARSFTTPGWRASWRGKYRPWREAVPSVCRLSTA